MSWWIVAPDTAVDVKGHSHAADNARAHIEYLTGYRSAAKPEASTATLEVDHILNPRSQPSWVVLAMTDSQHRVSYKKKAEELP